MKFNNVLYKFGWGRSGGGQYSEYFIRKGAKIDPKTKKKAQTLLPYSVHKHEEGSYDHLHLRRFDITQIMKK